MSTQLSPLAQTKAQATTQTPQLVLEIEGVEQRFGLGTIKKYIKIGDPGLVIGNAWKIGGLIAQEDQLDAITLEGTTQSIAQQLLQDQGGVSSVNGITVSLIDVDGDVTRLITPGEVVDDILGRRANVYLGYRDTAFPQDFIQIFAGMIDEVGAGATISISIASPEQKKRGQAFQKVTTELTQAARYRSREIQGMLFKTRRDVVGTVTITIATGASAGSEIIGVVGNDITFTIANGVTTRSKVRSLLEGSLAALTLVDLDLTEDAAGVVIGAATASLDSVTTLTVTETKGLLLPADGLLTYVRIGNEIIQYTGLTDTTITGCTRAALESLDERAFGEHHDVGASVESFYRIQGTAVELALKILMSGGPEYYAEDVPVKALGYVEGQGTVENAVYFDGINVADKYGVSPGTLVKLEDSAFPGNNVVDAVAAEIVATTYGSYIVLDMGGTPLTEEQIASSNASFKTTWNVWPEGAGLGMGGDEVDVPEFERIAQTFATSIFSYDFYLRDTMTVKDFIDQEVLFPTGCYALPRKGKTSLGFTSPPVGGFELKQFGASNIVKPEQVKIFRGIARYFYNNVVFAYNENLLDSDRFLSGNVTVDNDSVSRIRTSPKSFVVKARGLRPSGNTTTAIRQLTTRFLDRFKFGAERVKFQCFYGEAFESDVGDVVLFDGSGLNLPDTRNGTRNFQKRLFEIQNKTLNILTGEVTFDLVDTAYSAEGARFGVVSPASNIGSGSTTTELKIVNSFGNNPPLKERTKWTPYLGEKVVVHWGAGGLSGTMWTNSYERTFVGFNPLDENGMLISPALPGAPPAGAVVEIIPYPDTTDTTEAELFKRLFVFMNPTVDVTAGVSTTKFEVDPGDVGKFALGAPIILHKDTSLGLWDEVSDEVKVESVNGNEITTSAEIPLVDSTWKVELIGFPDGGAPYRYL